MLKPSHLGKEDIIAMDRAYIDYWKFEELTQKGVIYVTKMKKSLSYTITSDTMYQNPDGLRKSGYRTCCSQRKSAKSRLLLTMPV